MNVPRLFKSLSSWPAYIKQRKQIKQKYRKPREEQTGRNGKVSKLNNYDSKLKIALKRPNLNQAPPHQRHKEKNHCPHIGILRQILDPELLEAILEEESSVWNCKS